MEGGDRWAAVTALADPSRQALYDYVRRQNHPVSREEAAEAVRMSRGLAAFHLDKLVDAGLLHARYETPPDQPRGRGRAPKVYEVADDELAITIPQRRYELMAEILADAVADDPTHADDAAREHARQRGQDLGTRLHGVDLLDVLSGLGFEPDRDGADPMVLHNCPFHMLAMRQTELVCGLNHAFLEGIVAGLDVTEVHPRLAPRPGACCVELTAQAEPTAHDEPNAQAEPTPQSDPTAQDEPNA
jgi:predicted ArsR family transcriptional regulator